jgi:hypothetical protein
LSLVEWLCGDDGDPMERAVVGRARKDGHRHPRSEKRGRALLGDDELPAQQQV